MADGMAAFVWRGGDDVAVEEVARVLRGERPRSPVNDPGDGARG